MIQLIYFLLPLVTSTISMHIPEDIEILEGYGIETSAELSPDDIFSEARSLVGGDYQFPIRNKRSPKYTIMESPGLRSHFKTTKDDNEKRDSFPFRRLKSKRSTDYEELQPPLSGSASLDMIRYRRDSDSGSKLDDKKSTEGHNSDQSSEFLPTAEKQVMEAFAPEARSQSVIVDRWTKAPFEYAKVQKEEDSLAEASISEGISARSPRVNFVTQPKKKTDPNNVNDQMDQKASSTKAEVYKNLPEPRDDRYYSRQYEELPQYRKQDDYMPRYDRYDRDDYYDPYRSYSQQRSFDFGDPYMPRRPMYPDSYYNFPDSRYDLPEPRDYRPLYTNDITDRYPMPMTPPDRYPPQPPPIVPNRNRRIIYYATLPEIVRTPNDYKYKSYNNRYDDRYDPYVGYNNMDYNGYRTNSRYTSMPSMSTIKDDRNRDRDRDLKKSNKQSYQRPPPAKVLNTLPVKDDVNRPSSVYGGRPNEYGYQYY